MTPYFALTVTLALIALSTVCTVLVNTLELARLNDTLLPPTQQGGYELL